MKTILVVGATGQTGKLVVEKSLANDHKVRVIVRSRNRLPSEILEHPNITLVEANVLDLMYEQIADLVKECDAVVSCLGHVISFQGIFGEPKLLCTEATKRLCKAIESNRPTSPVKFILMNTVGVSNPDLREQREWFERVVLTLLRWLIPPHKDKECFLSERRWLNSLMRVYFLLRARQRSPLIASLSETPNKLALL